MSNPVSVPAEKIKAVLEKSANDVIGQAHATREELKALLAEAEAPVEAKVDA